MIFACFAWLLDFFFGERNKWWGGGGGRDLGNDGTCAR